MEWSLQEFALAFSAARISSSLFFLENKTYLVTTTNNFILIILTMQPHCAPCVSVPWRYSGGVASPYHPPWVFRSSFMQSLYLSENCYMRVYLSRFIWLDFEHFSLNLNTKQNTFLSVRSKIFRVTT